MRIRVDRWWKHNIQFLLCQENTCRAHRKIWLLCRKSYMVPAAVGRKCSCFRELDFCRIVEFERRRHMLRFHLSHCRRRDRSCSIGHSSRNRRTWVSLGNQASLSGHQFLATSRISYLLFESRSASTFCCLFNRFYLGSCLWLSNIRSKRASRSYHRTSSSGNVCTPPLSGIARTTPWISYKWRDKGVPPFGSRNALHHNRSGRDTIHRQFFQRIFWPRPQLVWPHIS